MNRRKKRKFFRVDRFAAEVDVHLIEDETGWSPYLNLEDARRLDEVREALARGDLETASRHGRIFELRPVAV